MARSRLPELSIVLFSGLTLLSSGPVHAQDLLAQDQAEREVDLARTLFADGVRYVAEGRFADAERVFRDALERRNAPAIRYNLASVLFEQGEYPEARMHVDLVLADATTPADLRTHTSELRAHIAELAGFARIELRGAAGAQVSIDGYLIPELDVELSVAPGPHVATAVQQGREIARAEVTIATGAHTTIVLDASPPPEEDTRPLTSGDAPLVEQWWFWTAIGGGVVLLAVVIGGTAAAVSSGSNVEAPIQGDFEPGLVRW